MICPNGPIFMMFWNCSYMSLRVNWPAGQSSEVSRAPNTWQAANVCVWILTVFQFVDQLLVIVQLQLVDSVDQTFDVTHS